jgi:hypothetical protein
MPLVERYDCRTVQKSTNGFSSTSKVENTVHAKVATTSSLQIKQPYTWLSLDRGPSYGFGAC